MSTTHFTDERILLDEKSTNRIDSPLQLFPEQYKQNTTLSNVIIPPTTTIIPRRCFEGCINLTTIVIPASVVQIGYKAFSSSGIVNVIFEEGSKLRSLSAHCFSECKKLLFIEIPKTIRCIGHHAFYNSAVRYPAINLPQLRSLGAFSFRNCKRLTEVVVPANVVEIEVGAFQSTILTSLIFLSNSYKGYDGCNGYSGNSNYDIVPNSKLRCISHQAFQSSVARPSFSIDVPSSVMFIGSYCFSRSSIKSIHFQSKAVMNSTPSSDLIFSHAMIGNYAFADCKQLSTCITPQHLTTIGDSAFNNSTIKNIQFTEDSLLYKINSFAFHNCSKLTKITIPSTVTAIDVSAFEKTSLIEVLFPANTIIRTIGQKSFYGIKTLSLFIIPNSLLYIGVSAFATSSIRNIEYTCPKATNSHLRCIDKYAFYNCINLTTVFIPSSAILLGAYIFSFSSISTVFFPMNSLITLIPRSAFRHCRNLASISLPTSVIEIASSAFSSSSIKTISFHCVKMMMDGSEYWTDENRDGCEREHECECECECECGSDECWENSKVISHSIDSNSTFTATTATTATTTTTTCTTAVCKRKPRLSIIAASAFQACRELESIYLLPSMREIHDFAFAHTSISHITFAKKSNLQSIAANAFYSTLHLKSIIIPKSVTKIGQSVFLFSNVESVKFESGCRITSIESATFADCPQLKHITIPSTVKSIDQYAFADSSIQAIYFGREKEEDDMSSALENSISISSTATQVVSIPTPTPPPTSPTPPSQLENIHQYAFNNCEQLLSISIPRSVILIDDYAFRNSNIASINFEKDSQCEILGYSIFLQCNNLKNIIIPSSVKTIRGKAFFHSAIEEIIFPDDSQVENLDKLAFVGCNQLQSIVFPERLRHIFNDALEERMNNKVWDNDNEQ